MWKKGTIQTDLSHSKDAIVVKSDQNYYILTEKHFKPGLKQLKTGWEIYFQVKNEEITSVFMYGPQEKQPKEDPK